MASEDKKKALDAAIAKLEKDFGKGTVMKLGDPAAQVAGETIPAGSLSLDIALGLGGVDVYKRQVLQPVLRSELQCGSCLCQSPRN